MCVCVCVCAFDVLLIAHSYHDSNKKIKNNV